MKIKLLPALGNIRVHSIKTKIFLANLLVLVIAIALIWPMLYIKLHDYAKSQAISEEQKIASVSAATLDTFFYETEQMSLDIFLDQDLVSLLKEDSKPGTFESYDNASKISRILSKYKAAKSNFYDISIIKTNGEIAREGVIFRDTILTNKWYDDFLKNRKLQSGFGSPLPFADSVTKLSLLTYCRKLIGVDKPNDYLGTLVISFKMSTLGELAQQADPSGKLMICGSDGEIYYNSMPDNKNYSTVKQTVLSLQGGSQGQLTTVPAGGFIIIQKALSNGWKIAFAVPESIIYTKLYFVNFYCLLALGIGLLVSFFIIFPTVGSVTRPIKKLHKATQEIAKGKFDLNIDVKTNDEIHDLSDSMMLMSQKIKLLLEQVREEEIANRQSELQKLSLQINPHFVYNTLNSVMLLAEKYKNKDIVDMIGSFLNITNDILRNASLKATLEEELFIVQNYAVVQKYCYGDLFDLRIDADEQARKSRVPRMMLQPIVENSIFHGLLPKGGRGTILLSAVQDEGMLEIRVTDEGVGMDPNLAEELMKLDQSKTMGEIADRKDSKRIGLINILKRLKILYGSDYQFRIECGEKAGTNMVFRFPAEF